MDGQAQIKFIAHNGVFFIVDMVNIKWADKYNETLEQIQQMAAQNDCAVIACWITRPAAGRFLLRHGWRQSQQKGVLEYVR